MIRFKVVEYYRDVAGEGQASTVYAAQMSSLCGLRQLSGPPVGMPKLLLRLPI